MEKYKGIIPAFYACYDDDGKVSEKRCKALARWLADKKVKGLYLCGSSGECIYQTVAERKLVVQWVMEELKNDNITIIDHVAANSIEESKQLAAHAEELGVDAIAAIPPIYFKLPEPAIAQYWNAISDAAPNTDFIIYNIPQLAGVSLTPNLLKEMQKNKKLVGVKNSSMPVLDIQQFKQMSPKDFVVLNGPDEQYIAGRVIGADGGIGGTYGVMPELFMEIDNLLKTGEISKAIEVQYAINEIIFKVLTCEGNLYAGLKEILRLQGVEIGTVRAPLLGLSKGDYLIAKEAYKLIEKAKKRFL